MLISPHCSNGLPGICEPLSAVLFPGRRRRERHSPARVESGGEGPGGEGGGARERKSDSPGVGGRLRMGLPLSSVLGELEALRDVVGLSSDAEDEGVPEPGMDCELTERTSGFVLRSRFEDIVITCKWRRLFHAMSAPARDRTGNRRDGGESSIFANDFAPRSLCRLCAHPPNGQRFEQKHEDRIRGSNLDRTEGRSTRATLPAVSFPARKNSTRYYQVEPKVSALV